MAEKTILLKLELDSKALTASAKDAEENLKRLEPQLKAVAASAGKNSVEYQTLREEVSKYTKQLKDNASAIQINNELSGKANLSTVDQARAQKALAVAYNALTKEERENTEEGRNLTRQYREMNEALQEQGLSVSDGRRSVGLYEKAIVSANKTIASLKEEQNKLGYAQTQNTKKLNEAQKGLDKLGDQADTTSAEYKDLTKEVNFYTKAIALNEKSLAEINDELVQQEEQLKITAKEAAAIGFVYGNNENAAKSLKKQIAELKAELATMDVNSEEFIEGTKRAGELVDKLKDVNEAIASKATGSKFEQLSNQFGLLSGDLQNLDFEGVAEKAAAFQQTASSISFKELSQGAGQAGKALISLGKTLVTSPLFLTLGAVGLIVAFWDDITEAIEGTDIAQDALNETVADYRKGAADAGKKTMEVNNAFKLAKSGTISQAEALKIYNTALGDSFGKATDLNEAEAIFNSKTKAYVESAGLRAQANALITKAAEEQANAVTAQFENNVSFLDATIESFKNPFATQEELVQTSIKLQKKGTQEARKEADKKAKIYQEEASRLLELAETQENANGIVSKSEKALNDELAALAKERADKAKAAAEARAEAERNAAERIRELILGNAELSADLQERQIEATIAFRKRLAELEITDSVALTEKLVQIEQDRADQLAKVAEEAKNARIATIESDLAEELKTLEGSEAQKTEQTKLLRQQADAELAELDLEFGQKEVERTQAVEAAKQTAKEESLKTEQQRAADRITVMEAGLLHEETLLRKQGKTEDEIAQATSERRIEIARAQDAIIQTDASKSEAEKIASAADLEEKLFEIEQEGRNRSVEATKTAEEQKKQIRDAAISAAEELANTLTQIQQDNITEQINNVNQQYNAEQALLADQLEQGLISQEKYNAEIKKAEVKKNTEEAKLKKAQFEKQKAADLVGAGISVSKAILSGFTSQPFFPVGIAMGTLASVLGAAQIAQIAGAETPAFATGGPVLSTLSGQRIGTSDGYPIYRSNGDNLLASVRKNEVILNEAQQQRAGGASFFASIGVPGFATGGATGAGITASVDGQALSEAFLFEAISKMPAPVVGVEDITAGLQRKADVEDSANIFK